jgi:hypothetical protein
MDMWPIYMKLHKALYEQHIRRGLAERDAELMADRRLANSIISVGESNERQRFAKIERNDQYGISG